MKAYGVRGGAYASKGEYDKVIADCNEALRLDSKLAYGWINTRRACR